jgi:signal transduction histidine kinase
MDSRRRPEAIDPRVVFWVYAALAWLFGLVLIGWGPMWLGANFSKAGLIRLLGSIVIAAGCCAAALAAVGDPRARRRGLFWFAAGHTAVWLVGLTQHTALSGLGLAEGANQSVWVAVALVYRGLTAEGEFAGGDFISVVSGPAKRLRSQYEQQIRQAAVQEERNRLARDLHDSIKQQLFVIQTAAATAQARADGDPAGASEALGQVRSSTREAMIEMEVMMDQLRSGPLENAGLIEALKQHCEALGFRTGARVEFHLEGDLPPSEALPPGAQEAILRVAQEALANVGRHARARNVQVSLYSAPGRVELQIKDDGTGFDPNQSPRGMGVANMRARAGEIGAEFELASQPGGGTFVRFSLPYTTAEAPREYLRRALWAGALLVAITVYAVLIKQQYAMTVLLALFAIQLIRNAAAYGRARRRSEATR